LYVKPLTAEPSNALYCVPNGRRVSSNMDRLTSGDLLLFEEFRFDTRGRCLFRVDQCGAAEPVPLGARALELLGLLVRKSGELVSKDEIMEVVWPGRTVEEANLNVQISKLRHILDQRRRTSSCIQTVTGHGYRFTAAVTRADAAVAASALPPAREDYPGKVARPAGLVFRRLPLPALPVSDRFWGGVITTMIAAIALGALLTAIAQSFGSGEPFAKPPASSIIVLPFVNLSNDQQYFADGITEDLTTDLSRVEQMFVISYNRAETYRGKSINTKRIGREPGVRFVLEGDVQRSGNHLSVNARLSDAETATNLWAERFEGVTDDLSALQNEITRRIVVAVNLEIIDAATARPNEHPDALDYILRGREILTKPPSRENRTAAIRLFERALDFDPHSVAAQSWLARVLTAQSPGETPAATMADIARAEKLVETALAAAPRNALAHYARGTVLRAQDRFAEAIPDYEAAIDFNRNWVDAYANLGQCKFYTGSIEEYIPLVEQAIRLSPRDPMLGVWLGRIGLAHLLQSHVDQAIYWLEKARGASSSPYVQARLASAYALQGETERAAGELAEARRLSGDDHYSSVARLNAEYLGVPRIRALYETSYFAGLRLAGMPEK
jgi:TolB-like protein/DNA-binding winged helix-turn-helix (wHTH) protein